MTTPVQFSDSPHETVSGLLDVRDKAAYLRPTFLPGRSDVRVSLAQVKQYGLRPGDHVVGSAGLASVATVNGVARWRSRPYFADLTPVHPRDRIKLETESLTTRLVDLFAPIGKGQRGLIVAPPKAGKTMVLQDILAGGIDAAALLPPRRFFGAARNVREGGSLTILATALVDNGSRMDDNLFEEFKGSGSRPLSCSSTSSARPRPTPPSSARSAT